MLLLLRQELQNIFKRANPLPVHDYENVPDKGGIAMAYKKSESKAPAYIGAPAYVGNLARKLEVKYERPLSTVLKPVKKQGKAGKADKKIDIQFKQYGGKKSYNINDYRKSDVEEDAERQISEQKKRFGSIQDIPVEDGEDKDLGEVTEVIL